MKIGAAEKIITPDVGVDLCGYLARVQPSTGKYDDLKTRVLVFEDGGERCAWVHCDLVGFTNQIAHRLRLAAGARLNIPAERVLLTATHTHSGPATVVLRKCGDIDPVYMAFLEERIVECAAEAVSGIEEVSLRMAKSTVEGIARDRTRPVERAHVDKTMPVLAFERADGTFKAILANFAVHNVGLSGANRKISADIAGFAAERVKRALAGNPPVFVTNGCCGNINPLEVKEDYSAVERFGSVLGDAIVDVVGKLGPKLRNDDVTSAYFEMELPLEVLSVEEIDGILAAHDKGFEGSAPGYVTDRFKDALKLWSDEAKEMIQGKREMDKAVACVQIFKIGPAVFVGINGEVFSRMAVQLRAVTGIEDLYVAGYANGCIGYICSAEGHADGGYAPKEAHKFYSHFGLKAGSFETLRDSIVARLKG